MENWSIRELNPSVYGVIPENPPVVELIAYSATPDHVAAMAAGVCQLSNNASALNAVISHGHTSVLEHNSFTWRIYDISSAALAQMTRHRIGCSYSVQSFRHTSPAKKGPITTILPSAIINNPDEDVVREYRYIMQEAIWGYQRLLSMGVPMEAARMVLPMGVTREMIVTMNARSLLHFAELRCAPSAEEEIRMIATLMYNSAREVAPTILPPLEQKNPLQVRQL